MSKAYHGMLNRCVDKRKYLYTPWREQMTTEKTVHLFFSKAFTDETFDRFIEPIRDDLDELYKKSDVKEIIFCSNWDSLTEHLKSKKVKSISIHQAELDNTTAIEVVNMVRTLSKLIELDYEISVSVSIFSGADVALIKDLQKSGIIGIIPNSRDYGWDECEKGVLAQWAGIPYWPKHIIDQLPGSKSKPELGSLKEIKLTPRQNQILNIVLERGSSNKVIARSLNISESTVKLHLGHIFKKYGVKNRTQLAVFAKK